MLAPNTDRLLDILSHKRPHLSDTDEHIIQKTFGHLITGDMHGLSKDKFGNRYYTIPTPEGLPKIIWACHSDTVHREKDTMQGIHTQKIVVEKGIIKLHPDEKDSNCLGGDDGVGMWLLSEMIASGVPGRYIIHRGEERGCLGSKYIAEKMQHKLEGYDACVSLDRRGDNEIITHQYGIRRCSDVFATSFAIALGMSNQLKPSQNGAITDSAHYYRLIQECANVGVGYENAHGKDEEIDLAYATYLRNHLCTIDLAKIVIARDPKEVEKPKVFTYPGYQHRHNHGWHQRTEGYEIDYLLKNKMERYFGPREVDNHWFDRATFKWIPENEKQPWPPVEGGATLLDNHKGASGGVIDLRPGSGFRSKDAGYGMSKQERKRRKKEHKRAKRAADLARRKQVTYQGDWREKYSPNGPADLKCIFEDQLTKFINRHARDFSEAVVAAGWTPADVLEMMFSKHGKMFDLDNVAR